MVELSRGRACERRWDDCRGGSRPGKREGYDLSLDLNASLEDERFSSFIPNEETANYAEGQHSLQLTTEELGLVAGAREVADRVVVLLNTGTTLEVGPLVEEGSPYQVDALFHVGFPGAVGAEVVGDVLCGRHNPCGRTCDLWARDMRLAPSFNTMGEHRYTDIHDFYPGQRDHRRRCALCGVPRRHLRWLSLLRDGRRNGGQSTTTTP